MLRILLEDIVRLQTGIFEKPGISGDVVYLQPRHFSEDGKLQKGMVSDLDSQRIPEKHLLRSGDVLFAAKGNRNFAVEFDSIGMPAVASTSWFVLRVTDSRIQPAFLAWYLNNPNTLQWLKGYARGSKLPSIPKSVLGEMEVPIPSHQRQELILKIDRLRNDEVELVSRIEALRDQKIDTLLSNALKNE